MFVNLDIQLHERREVKLGQLILGAVYEVLHQGAQTLRNLTSENLQEIDKYKISVPIWLLQLWLLATFQSKLQLLVPTDHTALVEARGFEGLRLSLSNPMEIGVTDKQLFSQAFKMFMDCDRFTPSMEPFVTRACGPTWFTKQISATIPDEETKLIWETYLTTRYLSAKISSGKAQNTFGAYPYHPSLLPRQFSLCQLRPSAFFRAEG